MSNAFYFHVDSRTTHNETPRIQTTQEDKTGKIHRNRRAARTAERVGGGRPKRGQAEERSQNNPPTIDVVPHMTSFPLKLRKPFFFSERGRFAQHIHVLALHNNHDHNCT